ncbi:MAG TPA: hypothetical protein VJT67_18175 [Longimicrobiaceae bacterium]|nr:hypothetical protein [Longimicrobiaceae bacterium]
MKKLRLELDDLCVESFATSPAGAGFRGTIDAFESGTDAVDCIDNTGTFKLPRQYDTMPPCYTDTGGTGGTGGGGTTGQQVTNYQSCNGTCYDPSCGGTCAGQATCNAQICVPF